MKILNTFEKSIEYFSEDFEDKLSWIKILSDEAFMVLISNTFLVSLFRAFVKAEIVCFENSKMCS